MKKMWETNMKKLVMMMLVAVMAFTFTACSSDEEVTEEVATEEATTEEVTTEADDTVEESDTATDVVADVSMVGEGETAFVFTVTFEDSTVNIYQVSTDATTVGEALVEVGLIDGEDSDYGLYVTTVDGVTLDWDTDAAYWAFYVDGEMAATGVDTTDIVAGSSYAFAYAQ